MDLPAKFYLHICAPVICLLYSCLSSAVTPRPFVKAETLAVYSLARINKLNLRNAGVKMASELVSHISGIR